MGAPNKDAHSSEVVILRQDRESAFTRCRPDLGVEPASEVEGFNLSALFTPIGGRRRASDSGSRR